MNILEHESQLTTKVYKAAVYFPQIMALEELVSIPYLPQGGYDNPVKFILRDNVLEVSYPKNGLFLIKHFFARNGMSLGYELYQLSKFDQKAKYDFINLWINNKHKWVQEQYGQSFDISSIVSPERENLIEVFQLSENFAAAYKQLDGPYWAEIKRVDVIPDSRTLSQEEFQEIEVCYAMIIRKTLDNIKNEEIKSYAGIANDFDNRLLLPYIKD